MTTLIFYVVAGTFGLTSLFPLDALTNVICLCLMTNQFDSYYEGVCVCPIWIGTQLCCREQRAPLHQLTPSPHILSPL